MPELIEADGHTVDANQIREFLIIWGTNNFRAFPWRMTRDPYKILLSELMLHRTQAKQVVPVYTQFIETYPTVRAMMQSTKAEMHNVLSSLGLHWRINLIYEAGVELINRFHGQIPSTKEDLLSLPGVSEYIASAVLCFTWNLPEPILDTNTVRVVGRVFGLKIKDSSRRNCKYKNLILALVDQDEPRIYNYALLDLANKICTKKRPPDCLQCPILKWCNFGKQQL